MKKKKLTNKDLDKYAEISNIPVEHLVSLNNMDALNVVNIHAILIKNEYKKLLDEYIKLAKNIEHPEQNEDYPETIRHSKAMQALYDNV